MSAQAILEDLLAQPAVDAAARWLVDNDEQTLLTQIELSEIAAPPFAEGARGARVAELFAEAGLEGVRRDQVGNVVAPRPGVSDSAPLVVSAHLDTVFPAGTDVRVTREGDVLRGPGVSDDARGLAALLALARALEFAAVSTARPLLFAATVGEEGAGDLRGVKALFGKGGAGEGADGFVSLDGAGLDRIVVRGLGSRRYRVSVVGPGGHSWVDWGTPNPIHALVALTQRLTALELSRQPRATLTVARIGGGKSINAIPQEAWIEVDTRCAAGGELDELERALRDLVATAASEHDALDFEVEVIGDRPGARTGAGEPLVEAAIAATRHQGHEPVLALSSTDANVPMALGVPALTLGCGGEAGSAHTTEEWYRNVDGAAGVVRALHTVLLFAGVG